MAVAYAKLYELILKKIKDEKEAKEYYDIIVELVREGKIEVKTEVKEELKDELATKKDLELLEERILRYVDEKFHYLDKKIDERFYKLDKKMTIGFVILILLYIITNPNAIELIKVLFGLR